MSKDATAGRQQRARQAPKARLPKTPEPTCPDSPKPYQEPLELQGLGLFGEGGHHDAVSAAFEAFKRVCGEDTSPIGRALHESLGSVRPRFAEIWLTYHDARQAEERAARARVKLDFVRMGEEVRALSTNLSQFLCDTDLRRYLLRGLRQHIARASEQSAQESRTVADRIISDLDLLAQVCRAEADLQHRPGEREDAALVRACGELRDLILNHAGVRVPKTIVLLSDGKFQNRLVEVLHQFGRCIDPRLTPSQVKTALQKLPVLPKAAKIQN